ncbi:protein IMPACT-like [Acanthaster planci]|uniref:Protein IMPACT-like n=1 Tax=Acanthaster planci TaxID=133434 RepID=A0A8B7XSR0_ACAPL|nr:protein IMPACT-like [Acanthaster planci]
MQYRRHRLGKACPQNSGIRFCGRMVTIMTMSMVADEIEALTAIYEDDWCVVDEANRIYCIAITHHNEQDKTKDLKICLQICLPPEYPNAAPPVYQINAPWLKDAERQTVVTTLEQVCSENSGECVLYLLFEQLREYLLDRAQKAEQVDVNSSSHHDSSSLSSDLHSRLAFPSATDCEIPAIKHGEPITDRRSTFQAHLAAPISTAQQVTQVRRMLLENRKIANATHNILAYRIYCEDRGTFLQDCDNDGEAAAGPRLLHLLEILDVQNVMVVVSRWYGGIMLGPDRFKHINNAARNILDEHGYIQKNEGRSKKKGKQKSR